MPGCQTLWIPTRLPGLNEILAGQSSAAKGWSSYNTLKQKWTGQIGLLTSARGLGSLGSRYFTYLFVEPNRRRDPSNIVAGGVKIIEDALQACELLPNDGWDHVLGFCGYWTLCAGRAGCLVHWGDEILTKEAMLALLEKEKGNGNFDDRPRAAAHEPNRAQAPKSRRRHAQPRRSLDRH